MGGPTEADRGVADRGTRNRLHAPLEPPEDVKPFSEQVLGLTGQAAIPDVLEFGLRWQIELDAPRREPPESRQELAGKLLKLWEFLKEMEAEAQRDPQDGALLIQDAMQALKELKGPVEFIELATGESIPVVRDWQDPVFPPWAPGRFPRAMSAEQIARYPKRPRRVDEIPPFFPDNVRQWTALRDYRPAAPPKPDKRARAKGDETGEYLEPIPLIEPEAKAPSDEPTLQEALDKAMERAAQALLHANLSTPVASPTPLVSGVIRTLSTFTLQDIARQTKVVFPTQMGDHKLLNGTEVILYHSVYSVVLDRNGNPINLNGRVPYAILVPVPGSQMQRGVPTPGSVFVSVQRYGDSSFRINGANITKVLFGGVGGFIEYGYGYHGPHYFQKAIQGYLNDMGPSYIASVTAEGSYSRNEITASLLWNKVPDVVTATAPFAYAEITVRIKARIENFDELLKEIGEQIVRSLIQETIREKLKDYLVKKVGKRVLPIVNVAFAVYDVVAGEEERIRLRHAIACVIMALKGKSDEDMTIAAKVLSKITADEFEDAVIDALAKLAKKHGKKLVKRKEPKSPEPKKADQPADPPEPAAGKENLAVDPKGTIDHPAPVTPAQPAQKKPYDPLSDSTRQEMAEAERLVQASKAQPTTIQPKRDQRAEQTRQTNDKGEKDTAAAESNRKTDEKIAAASAAPTPATSAKTAAAGGGEPPRGTREHPKKLPPGPSPPEKPIGVKEEELPEGTQKILPRPNQPTQAITHEQALRAAAEEARGQTALGHDAHHTALKKGPSRGKRRDLAERALELISIAGVSIDDEANQMDARGLPRRRPPEFESASQHWNLHNVKNMDALVQELENVRGDTDATRDVMRKHGLRMWEDRPIEDLDFRLGPDDKHDPADDEPPRPRPKPPPGTEPPKPPRSRGPRRRRR